MPQSRHRKTNKARKRPKAPYQGAKPKPVASSNNSTRIIAIVIVLALACDLLLVLARRVLTPWRRRGDSGGAGRAMAGYWSLVDVSCVRGPVATEPLPSYLKRA